MIEASLHAIIRDAVGDPGLQFTRDTAAYDVKGWDSVAQVSIILAVEQQFGIRLRTREIDGLRNVGDFIDLVREKTESLQEGKGVLF
jgi:acyl carrier protein